MEPVTVDVVFEERYWYPEDGGAVWLAGYQVVEPGTGRYLARDAPELAARGLRVAGVAGAARHHTVALQSDAAAPGRSLTLRRDPANAHDANAIAVDTAEPGDWIERVPRRCAPGEQIGWVPRELAAELARDLDAGEPWTALGLREQRPSPRDPRTGLTMLLARGPEIVLSVR